MTLETQAGSVAWVEEHEGAMALDTQAGAAKRRSNAKAWSSALPETPATGCS